MSNALARLISTFPFSPRLPLIVTVLVVTTFVSVSSPALEAEADDGKQMPLLAYYYIWYDVRSWDRAKTDYPLLGHYSSDDENVLRQHIQWAKTVGIDGFIVSWKSTEILNRRLEKLIRLAEAEEFKLAIIYQGLDFVRDPVPVERVAEDLDYFLDHYADNPVFDLFAKPMIIWSGTWEFSRNEVASITRDRRSQLLILASERNWERYNYLADLVDGDAYYWSSVNPDTFRNYPEKLAKMGERIHESGGLWIAPAAAGFDARLVSGTTVVDRKDGETLRTEMNAALQSSPDAIGLISWNEFSENSHIEPSKNYGSRYLQVLAEIRHADFPTVDDFYSSQPTNTMDTANISRGIALGMLAALVLIGLAVVARRTDHRVIGS